MTQDEMTLGQIKQFPIGQKHLDANLLNASTSMKKLYSLHQQEARIHIMLHGEGAPYMRNKRTNAIF